MASPDPRPPLIRLYERWNGLIARNAVPGVHPLLRLELGAGLVREPRLERIAALMDAMLAVTVPLLYLPPAAGAEALVRPKIRAWLSISGAGLALRLGYFGAAPEDAGWRAALAHLGEAVCAMPPRVGLPAGDAAELAAGEVLLQALWSEAPRRMMLVRVLAGRRALAVPLLAVARAVAEDVLDQPIGITCSLAELLGEEPAPSPEGRPALLLLRRRGEPVALRVEALVEHGPARVLSPGPLALAVPWLVGVCDGAGDAGPPELVIDPLALPGLLDGADDAAA